jgi:PAS domain S-box-containing protein
MSRSASLYGDKNLLRAVVEASPAGMLMVDAEGHIMLANRAAAEQFRYSIDELLEMSVDQLVPEAYRRAHRTHMARLMSQPEHRSMAAGRDLYGLRKDGTEFLIDISLHPMLVNDQQMVLANVLDATDRRRAAQEREQRQSMERLALLGQLAGAVAHEIRTPLCVIRNDAYFLEMMKDQLGQDGLECVQEINHAVSKAESIVSELLDYTRDPQGEVDDVVLTELIDAAIRDVAIPETVELRRLGNEKEIEEKEIVVRADQQQIKRALTNLLRNALQAIGDAGTIEIETMVEADHAAVQVIDTGPGIDPEYIDRVFEPLFTTKPKGIGLGLAVSRRYAERSGGNLTVQNTTDKGACFRLTLPLSSRST